MATTSGADSENSNQKQSKIDRKAVVYAITELNEKTGSSVQSITKYLKNNNDYDNRTEKDINSTVKRVLKAGIKAGVFETKTNGLNSRVKISKNTVNGDKGKSREKKQSNGNVESRKVIAKGKRKLYNVEETTEIVPRKVKKPSNDGQVKKMKKVEKNVADTKQKSLKNDKENHNQIEINKKLVMAKKKGKKEENVGASADEAKSPSGKLKKARKSLSKTGLQKLKKSTVVRLPTKKGTKKQMQNSDDTVHN